MSKPKRFPFTLPSGVECKSRERALSLLAIASRWGWGWVAECDAILDRLTSPEYED